MKLTLGMILMTSVSAFAPHSTPRAFDTSLQAEPTSRQAFLAAAGMAIMGAAAMPALAMDQENVSAPTEQWETGKPTAAAEQDRMDRFSNKRTQLDSNFAPIKRINLERKSPVVSITRLELVQFECLESFG